MAPPTTENYTLSLHDALPICPPQKEGGQIELRPGTHRLELQYFWAREHGYLEVYWTPPGGERAMIGPDELSGKGGLWLPGQVAEPSSPRSRRLQGTSVPM